MPHFFIFFGVSCQDGAKTAQDVPKTTQGGPKTAPRRPKLAPRRPKTTPRRPQDGPKTAQDISKTAQDGPRRLQDCPKTAPKRFKKAIFFHLLFVLPLRFCMSCDVSLYIIRFFGVGILSQIGCQIGSILAQESLERSRSTQPASWPLRGLPGLGGRGLGKPGAPAFEGTYVGGSQELQPSRRRMILNQIGRQIGTTMSCPGVLERS